MGAVDQPPDYYFEAYFCTRYLAHFLHKGRIDKVISLIPQGSFVLDAGCGSGIVSLLLATKNNCTEVGIDIRKECIDFASRCNSVFKFYQKDTRSLSLPYKFDVVLCMEVLEHFDSISQTKIINCLDSHLKDGGVLITSFPSKFYFFIEPLWKLVRKLLHPLTVFDDEEYHVQIPVRKLRGILRSRGYTINNCRLYTFGLINYIVATKKLKT